MFGFFKKRTNQQQHSTKADSRIREQNTSCLSPIVNYAFYKVGIISIPDESVGVFVADAVNLLGAMVAKGIFNVPVIVYRTGNLFKFYNHELILSGAIKVLETSDKGHVIETYGREMSPQSGFVSSKFLNVLAFDYDKTQDRINKKFYNVPVLYNQNK